MKVIRKLLGPSMCVIGFMSLGTLPFLMGCFVFFFSKSQTIWQFPMIMGIGWMIFFSFALIVVKKARRKRKPKAKVPPKAEQDTGQ